jgi:O-acetyl-ADP-ribose deacetylase (regulator of RNase III)
LPELDAPELDRAGRGREVQTRRVRLTLVQGDIAAQAVDAIVNAANSSLLGGGGVDGAIHRRGGPEILAECRRLRSTSWPDGLPPGRAVATTAGRLAARWVLHTVGPVYLAGEDRAATLESCYASSLTLAASLGARTIAFPLISAGAFGWPLDDAAERAVRTISAAGDGLAEARLVLRDERAYRSAAAAVDRHELGD